MVAVVDVAAPEATSPAEAAAAHVTQPWLSAKTGRRRRFCIDARGVKDANDAQDGKKLYRQQHASPRKCCVIHDYPISRSPSEFCRKNGFDRPFNFLQILSWFFFGMDSVLGFIFIPLSLSPVGAILFALLCGTGAAGTLVTALAVTKSDPADPMLFGKPATEGAKLERCSLCGPIHARSKHCRTCNKCIRCFDHHCKWLNNCIGALNYRWFLALIGFVGIFSLLLIVFCLAIIIEEAIDQRVEGRWHERTGWYSRGLLFSIITFLILLNAPLFALDMQLVGLHFYLVRKKLTTYEYITQRVAVPTDADGEGKSEAFCGDWIIIDKKRLKKARERMRRSNPAPPPTSENEAPALATGTPAPGSLDAAPVALWINHDSSLIRNGPGSVFSRSETFKVAEQETIQSGPWLAREQALLSLPSSDKISLDSLPVSHDSASITYSGEGFASRASRSLSKRSLRRHEDLPLHIGSPSLGSEESVLISEECATSSQGLGACGSEQLREIPRATSSRTEPSDSVSSRGSSAIVPPSEGDAGILTQKSIASWIPSHATASSDSHSIPSSILSAAQRNAAALSILPPSLREGLPFTSNSRATPRWEFSLRHSRSPVKLLETSEFSPQAPVGSGDNSYSARSRVLPKRPVRERFQIVSPTWWPPPLDKSPDEASLDDASASSVPPVCHSNDPCGLLAAASALRTSPKAAAQVRTAPVVILRLKSGRNREENPTQPAPVVLRVYPSPIHDSFQHDT